MTQKMHKTTSFEDSEIINSILDLHCDADIEIDPTYSKGNFYKKSLIKEPEFKYDIYPQCGAIYGDCRALPHSDSSFITIIFDPPFLATSGPSLLIEDSSNKINKRFGVYQNEQELHKFYVDSLIEFYRILKPGGILIFKCQDKVSSGIQYMSHVFIINEAERLGFYTKDLYILLAKNRIVANWQLKNQKNARKFHSYYIVFQKSNKKVKFIK